MRTSWIKKGLFVVVLLAIVGPLLFPFLWMLASSFKTQVDIVAWPPRLIFIPTLQNYERVFREQNLTSMICECEYFNDMMKQYLQKLKK